MLRIIIKERMGFGGSVAAMIISLRNNEIQRRYRRTSLKDKQKNYVGSYGKLIDHKKMSASEFENFKHQLSKKRKLQRIKNIVLASISIILTVLIFIYFRNYLSQINL